MGTRVDKWLWTMRLFKTRSEAAEACKGNKITIGDSPVKPAREVKPGDVVKVRKPLATFSFRVIDLAPSRQPAKNLELYMQNVTPQKELDKLTSAPNGLFLTRDRGAGRPTKRDRREIEALMEDFYFDSPEDWNDGE